LQEVNIGGGNQGAIHSAISGEPGYIGAGYGNYTFISDVPEPGVLALAGLGGLALLAYRRHNK
jgi:MYXO-CTERM domain-containing protein